MSVCSADSYSRMLYAKQILSADQPCDPRPGNAPADAGVTYSDDGSVHLCVYAPHASAVTADVSVSGTNRQTAVLEKGSDGAFRTVFAYQKNFNGPANTLIRIDGNESLDPFIPIIWTNNRPYNCIEFPSEDMDWILPRKVPHGTVTVHTFDSEVMGRAERVLVYTPAGMQNKELPVLYLLNGSTDNETSWFSVGRIADIFDNLLADGKMMPFIAVTVNAMLRENGAVNNDRDGALERMLCSEVIPLIEGEHLRAKENRAVAGLSMGAYMTADIAMHRPDLFAYAGTFTASLSQTPEQIASMYTRSGYVRPYHTFLQEVTAEQFASMYRVWFRSTTTQEDHPELFEADDRLFEQAGYSALPCSYRILYPAEVTKWNSWRCGIRDYAQLLFR